MEELGRATCQHGHTTLKTPVLVQSKQLSQVGHGTWMGDCMGTQCVGIKFRPTFLLIALKKGKCCIKFSLLMVRVYNICSSITNLKSQVKCGVLTANNLKGGRTVFYSNCINQVFIRLGQAVIYINTVKEDK